jgi:hypothetical protein
MARPRKAPPKTASVPAFAHDELQVFLQQLNAEHPRPGADITAPDMLGALMLAVQQLPIEVAAALLPAYEERERAELERLAADDAAE